MSDMVERVAKAIYEADDPWHTAWPWPDLQSDQVGVDQYRRIRRIAIAAIAAMQADAAPVALAVIKRIAEVSSALACQAGVGGMETAGSIISFLATNPQRIHDFMSGGSIIDWPISWQRAGCLSWQGMDGKIHWPGEGNIQ